MRNYAAIEKLSEDEMVGDLVVGVIRKPFDVDALLQKVRVSV